MTRTNPQLDQPTGGSRDSGQLRSASQKRRSKRKRLEFFGRVKASVWSVITAPIKLLFLPTKLVELFYFQGQKSGRRRRVKTLRQRVEYGLKDLSRLPYRLILTGFKRRRLKELVFLLPALVAFGLICFIGFQLSIHSQKIQDRYNHGAHRALLSGNLNLASTYFRHILDRSSLSAPQSLQWVTVLRAAGEYDQADQLLVRLAPDIGHGYPAAHAKRAIELAGDVDGRRTFGDREFDHEVDLDIAWVQSPNSNKVDHAIQQLRTHLRSANEEDPRIHLAWAKYWLCQRDVEAACERIELANESHELSLEAVHLIDRRLDAEHLEPREREQLVAAKRRTLSGARDLFERKLEIDPLDNQARIQLAATLVRQENLQEAKDCLRKGIVLQADPSLRRGLADVFVLEYQSKTVDGIGWDSQSEQSIDDDLLQESLQARVTKLKAAIDADPGYILPYVCLAKLLDGPAENGEGSQHDVEQALIDQRALSVFQQLIASDNPSALDHIGLASLYWQQGRRDLADWHLDQAWAIDPSVWEKAHRLATAFAFFSDAPDLPWARKLVDRALLASAKSQELQLSEVLLAQGRILLEQGEPELAVQQLTRSLSMCSFPEEVHEALEVGYAKLGKLTLAYKHSDLARAARTRRIVADWN